MPVLIDSNVIIDILTEDQNWYSWSSEMLSSLANTDILYINPVIYAEISTSFERIEELEDALPTSMIRRDPLPYEAAFLAGKCFLRYRKQGGGKTSPLPDFFIGAHAAVRGWTLLSRDKGRYTTYFPSVKLISPQS